MKRAAFLVVVLALVVTSCGLKVPVTIVAGEGFEGTTTDGAVSGPGTSPTDDVGSVDVPVAGEDGTLGDIDDTGDPTEIAESLFKNETEGVSKTKITICTHVPITGAAPIPHHPARFGQFYFDYVNKELGGIYGRDVEFIAYNDNYNPAGARDAVEKCRNKGAFFYVGAAGTDQIVSVARWAEQNKLPYLHGPTSDKDLKGLLYNVHIGPTYEYQHKLLAQFLFKKFGKVNYGVIRVNSPYFDAGSKAFEDEIKRLGGTVAVNIPVQKDESQFQNVYIQLQRENVQVINNFTTPTIWLKMLNQKPTTYDPTWSAVSPVAGFNIVAQALSGAGARAFVFHHFNPACECATYERSEINQHKDLPWYGDIIEFLDIFNDYSPEKDPPPDDFDYASYLGAKSLHRLLLKIGDSPTRTKLWDLFDSYKEKPAETFPACGADFTRSSERKGAWQVNIFELKQGVWSQQHPAHTCVDKV